MPLVLQPANSSYAFWGCFSRFEGLRLGDTGTYMDNADTSLIEALAESFRGPDEKSMPRPFNTDFCVWQNAGLVGFVPASEAAEHWVEKHVMADCPLWVERHDEGDLLRVLSREGFHVSVGMAEARDSVKAARRVTRGQPHH